MIPYFLIIIYIFFKPTRWYSGKVVRVLSEETKQLIKYFNNRFFNNQLPVNIIGAIILVESNDNATLKGVSGEHGIMQVMPSTFEDIKEKYQLDFEFNQLFVKKLGVLAGMFVFYDYLLSLNFDVWNTVRAYNTGVTGSSKGKGWAYLQKVWGKL